jgi:hypothetical protein
VRAEDVGVISAADEPLGPPVFDTVAAMFSAVISSKSELFISSSAKSGRHRNSKTTGRMNLFIADRLISLNTATTKLILKRHKVNRRMEPLIHGI